MGTLRESKLFRKSGRRDRKVFHFFLKKTYFTYILVYFLQCSTNYGSYSTLNIMKCLLGQEEGYKQKPLS